MEIYWFSGSPYAWRALLALEIKHINYGSRVLEISKREHQSPEFRALSPRGKVPVLKDGDFVLSESLAIMTYLDRRFPDPPLFGRSPEDAGLIVKAISEFDGYTDPLMRRVVLPAFFGKVPEMADDMAAAAKELRPELGRDRGVALSTGLACRRTHQRRRPGGLPLHRRALARARQGVGPGARARLSAIRGALPGA